MRLDSPQERSRTRGHAAVRQCDLYRKREGGVREAAAAALQGADVERSVQLSCGEHTDYGLLTLVNQDLHVSALQVGAAWCAGPLLVPPLRLTQNVCPRDKA